MYYLSAQGEETISSSDVALCVASLAWTKLHSFCNMYAKILSRSSRSSALGGGCEFVDADVNADELVCIRTVTEAVTDGLPPVSVSLDTLVSTGRAAAC